MSQRLRLAAVSFLNARPITYGIERCLVGSDRFELRFDLPSQCAAAVAAGEADLGLMPIGAYGAAAINLRLAPGIAIASRGPVRTVMLLGEVPREEMESVVLDEASRTSQLLVQILLRERGLAPAVERASHDEVVEQIGGKPRMMRLRIGLGASDLHDAANRSAEIGGEPAWQHGRIAQPFAGHH